MFLSEPGQTSYDLKFTFLGFPCRVHPAFFILPVIFSNAFNGMFGINTGIGILIVAAVFFISVLVHELGHTLAFRYFGINSRIVLYWMGGLAIPGGGSMGSWGGGRSRSLKPNEQIIVSLAGPVAGLLLALFFTAILLLLSGGIHVRWLGPFPVPFENSSEGTILANFPALHMFIRVSIIINIVLNIFNLLPVYPLDGGQIARQLFVKADPWAGVRKSVILSMCVAVFVALYSLQQKDTFLAIFFGFMAWSNYQSLVGGGNNRRPW